MLHSGPFPGSVIQIGAAADPAGEAAHHSFVPPPEPAHVVAKMAVPFRPAAVGEAAHLIGAGGIPGFGDQLRVAQDRILGDAFQQGRVGQDVAVTVAAEHRGEVEAEAVDVHLHHPVAQRVEDEVAHHRMRRIDRLSRAGEVAVEALVVVQPVVDRVVDPAKADRRPQLVAFDRVVENDVEDHLDALPRGRPGPSP